MAVTEDIVRFVDEASFEALPDEVVFRTKMLIADAIGTMLAGSVEDGSLILQNYLKRTESHQEATVVDNRYSAYPEALHDVQRLGDKSTFVDRYRIYDHSGFTSLNLVDLFSLCFDGEVLMNHSDPALLRQSDRKGSLRNRIHCRGTQRNVEFDPA